MQHRESFIKPSDRVYLVASDLRLSVFSYQKYNKCSARAKPIHSTYLSDVTLKVLHEKHWAVKKDDIYYGLAQIHGMAEFTYRSHVDDNDRHIIARIFLGPSHMGPRALEEIGTI